MKILAIDTTAHSAACALCEDSTQVASFVLNAGFTHSETMLPMIEQMLKDAQWTADDIDFYACSVGPGSFTGVRIGVSVIKGLAFGKNKICVGVSSLDALARNVLLNDDSLLVPVIDARRNQLYNALFSMKDGRYVRLTEDRMSDASELFDELREAGKKAYFVGDGTDIMKQYPSDFIRVTSEMQKFVSGYGVAMAAVDLYNHTEDKSIFTDSLLMPSYLRPSQAERMAQGKNI